MLNTHGETYEIVRHFEVSAVNGEMGHRCGKLYEGLDATE